MSDPVASPTVFSRKASGLIRVGSSFDVFIYNIGLVSVGIAIAYNQFYGPSLYPGAQPWLSTLLAGIGMLIVAVTFYCWSVVFPRSGGVYVFLSRTISPGVAFVLSLVETVILLYYGALAAGLIVQVGLSSFFSTVGLISANQSLVDLGASIASPSGVFWIGTGIILLAGLILASGTRRYFTVQRVLFIIASAGLAFLVIVMLVGSRDGFTANLERLTGLNYQAVIQTAADNGYALTGTSFGASLAFMVWPLLPLLGAIQSIGIGGEVKKVRRSQLMGMVGAVAVASAVIMLFDFLSNRVFGYEFQGAIAYNWISGLTDGTTTTAPWFAVLAGILSASPLISVIIMAVFTVWIWFWIPAEISYTTRSMIAWSFDRIAPDRLGYVSERFHTPVVAIGLSTIGAIFFMWLIAFQGIMLLTLVEVLLVVWGLTMVCAVVFPKVRKQMYDASPVASMKVLGIPVMPLAGVLSVLFFGFAVYLLWTDPIAAGPLWSPEHVPVEFWVVIGTLVFGTVWYLAAKAYRKSKGVDISLAFRQIPIE